MTVCSPGARSATIGVVPRATPSMVTNAPDGSVRTFRWPTASARPAARCTETTCPPAETVTREWCVTGRRHEVQRCGARPPPSGSAVSCRAGVPSMIAVTPGWIRDDDQRAGHQRPARRLEKPSTRRHPDRHQNHERRGADHHTGPAAAAACQHVAEQFLSSARRSRAGGQIGDCSATDCTESGVFGQEELERPLRRMPRFRAPCDARTPGRSSDRGFPSSALVAATPIRHGLRSQTPELPDRRRQVLDRSGRRGRCSFHGHLWSRARALRETCRSPTHQLSLVGQTV